MNSLQKEILIPLPKKQVDSKCFGCGPGNDFGLKMEFYTNKERNSVYSWLAVPNHMCGWGNLVHGGIVTTILDEAMGWAAVTILQKFFLTKTLTTNFYQPIFAGQEIFVTGDVLETRNNRKAEVQAAVYDSNGKLSARATSIISVFTLEAVKEKQLFKGRLFKEIESTIKEFF